LTYLDEVPGDPGPDKDENVIVEVFEVASGDVEKGEILTFTGTGVLTATATTAATTAMGPFYVALEDHTYTTASDHLIRCGVVGVYDVQKLLAADIVKGEYVQISATDGEVRQWSTGSVVGIAMETSGTSCYSCLVLMGTYP
jgi:predicted RecA/RadA family phage recombinase